ncbi:MAG: hypothetical protein KGL39_07685 [Patescibacteria group bacterium]|nr:hypothetical protein [Patescibacteria group bacterium]
MIEHAATALKLKLLSESGGYAYAEMAQSDPFLMTLDGDFDVRDFVRVVIATMREPTPAMIDAAKSVAARGVAAVADPDKVSMLVFTGIDEWRAMIDVALTEKSGANV